MDKRSLHERDCRIHALKREGLTQKQIAAELKTFQPVVCQVLKRLDPALSPERRKAMQDLETGYVPKARASEPPETAPSAVVEGDPAEECRQAVVAAARRMREEVENPTTPLLVAVAAARAISDLANSVTQAKRAGGAKKSTPLNPLANIRLVPPREA